MGGEKSRGVGRGEAKQQPPRDQVVRERTEEEPRTSWHDPESEVMTRAEAAAFLRVSLRTLDRLPVPRVKLGHRTVRFLRADLVAYLAQHREAA